MEELIWYINENFRYGTTIYEEDLKQLFYRYEIKEYQKKSVYRELEELNIYIKVCENKGNKLLVIKEILKEIENNQITKKRFEEILNKNNLEFKEKEAINKYIFMKGIEIKDDSKLDEDDIYNFFLEDYEDIKEKQDFNLDDNINNLYNELIDVSDIANNKLYLQEYNSTSEDDKKKALENLLEANIRLVESIANKYLYSETCSFDKEDMIQMGQMGLIKGIEKFDISKGFELSTYVTHWIRQSITRGIADYSTTIRVPVHTRELILKLNRAEKKLYKNLERPATAYELSEEINIKEEKVFDLYVYREYANLISLDAEVGEDRNTRLGSLLKDDKEQAVEDIIIDKDCRKVLLDILDNILSDKEKNIILYRFGFINGEAETLETIAKRLGVTRERVRQIESKALSKIRRVKSNELKEYLYEYK